MDARIRGGCDWAEQAQYEGLDNSNWKTPVLIYSSASGAYAGINLEGSKISTDDQIVANFVRDGGAIRNRCRDRCDTHASRRRWTFARSSLPRDRNKPSNSSYRSRIRSAFRVAYRTLPESEHLVAFVTFAYTVGEAAASQTGQQHSIPLKVVLPSRGIGGREATLPALRLPEVSDEPAGRSEGPQVSQIG